MSHDWLQHTSYTIKRRIIGYAYDILGPDGTVVSYAKRKVLKLKLDLRIFTDESIPREALSIISRGLLDISAVYDVHDMVEDKLVGSLKRLGIRSIFSHEKWALLDADGGVLGVIREESNSPERLLRILTNIGPQRFVASVKGCDVCIYNRSPNPFVRKVFVKFLPGSGCVFDRRLAMAAGLLLNAVHGRRE